MNTRDLNHFGKNKITVLRQYCNGKFFVCNGVNFSGNGLQEQYQEFNSYTNALDYFNSIQN